MSKRYLAVKAMPEILIMTNDDETVSIHVSQMDMDNDAMISECICFPHDCIEAVRKALGQAIGL